MEKIFIGFVIIGLTGWGFGAIRWVSNYQDISSGVWAFGILSIVSYLFYHGLLANKKK